MQGLNSTPTSSSTNQRVWLDGARLNRVNKLLKCKSLQTAERACVVRLETSSSRKFTPVTILSAQLINGLGPFAAESTNGSNRSCNQITPLLFPFSNAVRQCNYQHFRHKFIRGSRRFASITLLPGTGQLYNAIWQGLLLGSHLSNQDYRVDHTKTELIIYNFLLKPDINHYHIFRMMQSLIFLTSS